MRHTTTVLGMDSSTVRHAVKLFQRNSVSKVVTAFTGDYCISV